MPLPLKFDYQDIPKKVVCDIHSRNCMLHVAMQKLPWLDGVRNFIIDCFNENNIDNDEEITYMQVNTTRQENYEKIDIIC